MTTRSKYFPPQTPKPAGSSPALRIACPVCHAPAGSYCSKTVPYALGKRQTIAHKRRREKEERTR